MSENKTEVCEKCGAPYAIRRRYLGNRVLCSKCANKALISGTLIVAIIVTLSIFGL